MWIIKIGGSLLRANTLKKTLAIISQCKHRKIIIVPGGSIFAEHIRTTQQKWKFNNKAAHKMALLAMEQYAHLMQSYAPQLQPTNTFNGIKRTIQEQKIPLWLPSKMINQANDIPCNWQITSDSLALWLAKRIHAKHTILIKSLEKQDMNARQLAQEGIIDQAFPKIMQGTKTDIWWVSPKTLKNLQTLLQHNQQPSDQLQPIHY